MPTILTDLDGTLFDFPEHFEQWALDAGYPIKTGVLAQTYMFQDMFDHEIDVVQFLGEFFASDETFASFPPLRGCTEPVQRLHDAGWEFVGITACDDRMGLAELRRSNFRDVFGFDLKAIHVTGFTGTKELALRAYEPAVWVEDNRHYAAMGAEIGHQAFLIDHPYNQGDGPFARVNDWNEIAEALS